MKKQYVKCGKCKEKIHGVEYLIRGIGYICGDCWDKVLEEDEQNTAKTKKRVGK